MKCRRCGEEGVTTRTVDHHYTECGLDNVYLMQVPEKVCSKCDTRTLMIPAIEQLHRVIALAILTRQGRLLGPEIRYLRKYLGYSQVDFAKQLGKDPSVLCRCEKGDQAIGTSSDRLIRMLVAEGAQIQEYKREEFFSQLVDEDIPASELRLRKDDDWHRLPTSNAV